MELVNYDPKDDTATIKFSVEDVRCIASVFSVVLDTFPDQDATLLGIDEKRLERMTGDIHAVGLHIGKARAGR